MPTPPIIHKRRNTRALSANLEKRLAAYAAAAATGVGVLALAPPADAGIIVSNHKTYIDARGDFAFQINGATEFSFEASAFSNCAGTWAAYIRASRTLNAPGHFLGTRGGQFLQRLPKGQLIGPSPYFERSQAMVEAAGSSNQYCTHCTTRFSGQWKNLAGYFGFEFLSKGQTYYGWALLDVTVYGTRNGRKVTGVIDGFAYDTVPNQAIRAGQTEPGGALPVSTPEPATLGLLALGSLGIGFWRRRLGSRVRPASTSLRTTSTPES